MGIDEEENTTTAASEMCSNLSISSIYRSSTVITQFKFSGEKAVFRISFTISPKYTFWQVYAWCAVLLAQYSELFFFIHSHGTKRILGYVTVMAT